MSDFVVRHLKSEEYADAGDLVARVFSFGNPQLEQHIRDIWLHKDPYHPEFGYQYYRVGLLNGKVISHVVVKPYILRYGSVHLRVIGVGGVATDPAYRGQGYVSLVMQDAMNFLDAQQAHLGLLTGIPNYYNRFGFYTVWPDQCVEISSAEAAALDAPLKLREATLDDVPSMMQLYDQHWGQRMSFVRSPALWTYRMKYQTRSHCHVVENTDGLIVGYIASKSPTTDLAEIVVDTHEAAQTILSATGRDFQNANRDEIRWALPPDDALVSFARQLVDLNLTARHSPRGGWMARFGHHQALAETLRPELVRRAQSAWSDFEAHDLIFTHQADRHTFHIGRRSSPTPATHLDEHSLMMLLFGYVRADQLHTYGTHLSNEIIALLDVLFPPHIPSLACWDWF